MFGITGALIFFRIVVFDAAWAGIDAVFRRIFPTEAEQNSDAAIHLMSLIMVSPFFYAIYLFMRLEM